MKNKNLSGYDGITSKILKLSGDYISKPLTIIFNKSLALGTYPNHLKCAKVQPHFKKGQRSLISNYRPISLLTDFSKIFELLIFRTLKQHLGQHNILVPEQHSFRAKYLQ
jgi:hypothetical protein